MAIDKLQDKIRKLKNPSMLDFSMDTEKIPPHILFEEVNICAAYERFCRELLSALKNLIPAVRFSVSRCMLMGAEGLNVLERLTAYASEQGYYVLLDVPEILSAESAEHAVEILFQKDTLWKFHGLVLSFYIGSDAIKPFVDRMKDSEKDLFLTVRTANRSASELQDLLTGSRLVYTAAADMAKRFGEAFLCRCGYSRIAGLGPATSADVLRGLRTKYPELFLLVDGFEYSGANAKNCSYAFDKLGHGAIACAGSMITTAWKNETDVDSDPVMMAQQAAERMKKNLTRYVTVL